jgi:hypothetical protein
MVPESQRRRALQAWEVEKRGYPLCNVCKTNRVVNVRGGKCYSCDVDESVLNETGVPFSAVKQGDDRYESN